MSSPLSPFPLLLVFAGGGAGTASRYGLDQALAAEPWPASTFLVNVVGSMALGLLVGRWRDPSHRLRLLVGTGFLGAFTTYSAVAAQTVSWSSDEPVGAVIYLFGSVALGLVSAGIGLAIGSKLRST